MARIRPLKNAPITEALIDVRVELPQEFDPAVFEAAHSKLSAQFPNLQRRHKITAQIKVGTQTAPEAHLDGIFLRSKDELTIAQFRRDGFTLNRLKPYGSFDELLPNALRLWDMYVNAVQSVKVVRLAVRYINHLQMPQGRPLGEILTLPPEPPPGPLKAMAGFLSRFNLIANDGKVRANLTQAVEATGDPDARSILLDVDVYEPVQLEAPAGDSLGGAFQRLRTIKNEIFFGAITEETAATYE